MLQKKTEKRVGVQRKKINLLGTTFGKWQVLEKSNKSDKKHHRWICLCECGIKKEIRGDSLLKKNGSRSCKQCSKPMLTHGYSHTLDKNKIMLYRLWARIKRSCLKKTSHSYKYYGARGIKVCKKWMKFEGFLEDIVKLGKRPQGYSIDRKKNEGNYELKNVRWASRSEQNRNTRRNHKIIGTKIGARPKKYNCIAEAKEDGFNCSAISNVIRGSAKTHQGFSWNYAEMGLHTREMAYRIL